MLGEENALSTLLPAAADSVLVDDSEHSSDDSELIPFPPCRTSAEFGKGAASGRVERGKASAPGVSDEPAASTSASSIYNLESVRGVVRSAMQEFQDSHDSQKQLAKLASQALTCVICQSVLSTRGVAVPSDCCGRLACLECLQTWNARRTEDRRAAANLDADAAQPRATNCPLCGSGLYSGAIVRVHGLSDLLQALEK